MKPTFTVSVVVPVQTCGDDFRSMLGGLFLQQGCTLEIVVLDSSGVDHRQEFSQPGLRWLDVVPSEFSHSATRNRGVAAASHPLVFLTVEDARLDDPYALNRLCQILTDEKLVALSAAETPRPDADPYARYALHNYYSAWQRAEPSTRVDRSWEGSAANKLAAASLGNVGCLYRRDILLQSPFEGSFAEDFDLAVRLLRQGLAVGKTNQVTIVHSHTRPAYYTLQRASLSCRLMRRFGLHETSPAGEPLVLARLVEAVLFWSSAGGHGLEWSAALANLRLADPRLCRFIEAMGLSPSLPLNFEWCSAVWKRACDFAQLKDDEREGFLLKVLADRLGWELGMIDAVQWSTASRQSAVTALGEGV